MKKYVIYDDLNHEFWKKRFDGTTTDISEAHRYGKKEAKGILDNHKIDIPIFLLKVCE